MSITFAFAVSAALTPGVENPLNEIPLSMLRAMTRPLINARCELWNEQRERFILRLKQTGGRAYSENSQKFGNVATMTPSTTTIIQDDTKLFNDQNIVGFFDNAIVGGSKPNVVKIETIKISEYLSSATMTVGLDQSDINESYTARRVFVGFCEVSRKKQSPIPPQRLDA